jgi:hypothetical protein
MASKAERHQPMVAHDLVNKLSIIIGNCHLLNEMTEPGTEYARRLALIRDTAESAVKELTEQLEIAAEIGRSGTEPQLAHSLLSETAKRKKSHKTATIERGRNRRKSIAPNPTLGDEAKSVVL